MTARTEYIHNAVTPDLHAIAMCLRQIGTVLDKADDKEHVLLHHDMGNERSTLEWAHAWMGAALYIADTTDITTEVLREVGNALDAQAPQPIMF